MTRDNNNESSRDETVMDQIANLTDDQWIRGQKPEGLEQRCLDLCRTYLAGVWITATKGGVEDIEVTRISGGLTNQLYRVRLRKHVTVAESHKSNEPIDVAIKLFQEKHMKNYRDGEDSRLSDIIILTIMSHTGLGPKVYGIFKDGFIQAYHEHEQFRAKHQQNPVYLRKLVSKLAQMHNLNVPICKQSDFMIRQIRDWNTNLEQLDTKSVANDLNLPLLASFNFDEERQQLERYFGTLRSKKVLCHNDFRGSNLLVINGENEEPGIVLVDLEYSSIDNRAQDFVTFLLEWGNDSKLNMNIELPSQEVMENFCSIYAEECEKLQPGFMARKENSIEEMIKEINIVALGYYLFFISFMAQTRDTLFENLPYDLKQNMKLVETIIDKYYKHKSDIQHLLPPLQ